MNEDKLNIYLLLLHLGDMMEGGWEVVRLGQLPFEKKTTKDIPSLSSTGRQAGRPATSLARPFSNGGPTNLELPRG